MVKEETVELSLENVTRRFGQKDAVAGVSAVLKPGVYGLLGANGAGKTTLMRMVCDVLRPTSGRIAYNGVDVASMGEEYRALLGYLPQDFGYYPDFTAMDFMLYMAALKGVPRRKARSLCADLLDEVGLADHAKAKIRTFSGGMKQRLGIAQAVLNDPEILVLDEPTAGLDPKERVRFRNLIAGFSQDKVIRAALHAYRVGCRIHRRRGSSYEGWGAHYVRCSRIGCCLRCGEGVGVSRVGAEGGPHGRRAVRKQCALRVGRGGRRSCCVGRGAHRRGSFRRADAGRFVSLHVQGR